MTCPNCHSKVRVDTFTAGNVSQRQATCPSCGYIWKIKQDGIRDDGIARQMSNTVRDCAQLMARALTPRMPLDRPISQQDVEQAHANLSRVATWIDEHENAMQDYIAAANRRWGSAMDQLRKHGFEVTMKGDDVITKPPPHPTIEASLERSADILHKILAVLAEVHSLDLEDIG